MGLKNTTNSTSPLPQSTRRAIQSFLVVWLDANMNESTPDFKNSLAQLKHVVAFIETYKDAGECIKFIQHEKGEQVFMIVSGAAGQNVVPAIHEWNQVYSIYIFCENKPFHEQWSSKYAKVKGVHTDIIAICEGLRFDCRRCDQNLMPMNFQKTDPLFMYTQLIKEAILEIHYDDAKAIKELAEYFRGKGNTLQNEIREFQQTYTKEKAIWWYKRDRFLYRSLNYALRVFDVDILMKMAFYMGHLHRQIQEVSDKQHSNPKVLTLYRGQRFSKENFKKLKQTIKGLMSFNNFLSTNYKKDISLRFAQPTNPTEEDTVGILFVMQIDTDLCKKFKIPFVDITDALGPLECDEAEVLFTTHTVFRIENVQELSTDRVYQVNLTMVGPDTFELKEVTDSLRQEIGDRRGFDKLATIFLKTGLSEQAIYIYHALLKKATRDEEITKYNCQLGWVYSNLGDYKNAICYYERDLECMKKRLAPNDLRFASSYNEIGLVYKKMGDYSKALSSYQQSFDISKQYLPPNHPDLAASYINIGSAYDARGDYSNALLFYNKALEIQKRALPPNHPDLAACYNNIGFAYENSKEYKRALDCYKEALRIWETTLPAEHPNIATVKRNIESVTKKKKM